MDVNEARRYDTAVCIDHLLIASVIFHFSDGLYLSAINDNIQNLISLTFRIYHTSVFNQNHLSSSCFICFYVSYP